MKPNTCESCAGNAGEPASRSIAWRPLIFVAGLLVFSSPVFDVALGLAVMGAAAGHALREWKDEKHLREFAPWLEGENCERK